MNKYARGVMHRGTCKVASFTRSGEPLPAEWYAGGCVNTEATRPRMATDRDAGVDLAARQR